MGNQRASGLPREHISDEETSVVYIVESRSRLNNDALFNS